MNDTQSIPTRSVLRGTCATLLLLCACGPTPVFRAELNDKRTDFEDISHSVEGTAPLKLVSCGRKDPVPQAIDDEYSMCLNVEFDEARLESLGAGAVVKMDGTASFSVGSDDTTLTFTPGAEHDTAILRAWGNMFCFAGGRTDPVTQQLRGDIVLERVEAGRLAARVKLTLEGELAGYPCGNLTGPAEFDYTFDEPRQ